MRTISRKTLYIASIGLSLVLAFLITDSGLKARERITAEYFAHKEFLFMLKNAKHEAIRSPTEENVRRIFGKQGIKVKSISKAGTDLEVKAQEVHWRKLPPLIRELEKRFTIVSIRAVDNTGRGIFSLRIIIR